MHLKKPSNPNFSSGPCSKNYLWKIQNLSNAFTGRSHRSKEGKNRLYKLIELTKEVLEIPNDYLLGIVPGSDTGAIEIALWNFLGERGVDVLAWDSFGLDWVDDIVKQLKLKDTNVFKADYGQLPDFKKINFLNDIIFTWNGTSSGVCIPDTDWIDDKRKGLTICDATSAVFAMDIDWKKIDVCTFSWQKALGGEAAHGVIILSPKAVNRINGFTPLWPIPKLFNLKKKGILNLGIFRGITINTPSMIAVEDCLDALKWAQNSGGLSGLITKSKNNLNEVRKFCRKNDWIDFLSAKQTTISRTSVCLKIVDTWFLDLDEKNKRYTIKRFCDFLSINKVAFDIEGYRSAPPGIRIWCGPTIETEDVKLLMPWLNKAWQNILQNK